MQKVNQELTNESEQIAMALDRYLLKFGATLSVQDYREFEETVVRLFAIGRGAVPESQVA